VAKSDSVRSGERVPENLGARLRRLRLERALSQRDISSDGVSYAYVSRIEADVRKPSVKAIRKLAERLGVSPEYLEYGVDGDSRDLCEARLGSVELALRLGDAAALGDRALDQLVEESERISDPALVLRARLARVRLALARGDKDLAGRELDSLCAACGEDLESSLSLAATLSRLYLAAGRRHDATDLLYSAADRALREPGEAFSSRGAGLLFTTLARDLGLEEASVRFLPLFDRSEKRDIPAWEASELSERAGEEQRAGNLRAGLASARKAVAELDALEAQREIAAGLELCAALLDSAGRPGEAEAIRAKTELSAGAIHPRL